MVEVPLDEVEKLVHDFVAEPLEAEEQEVAEPSLEGGVACAEMDGLGYTKSALMPWAANKQLCRIAWWTHVMTYTLSHIGFRQVATCTHRVRSHGIETVVRRHDAPLVFSVRPLVRVATAADVAGD